MQGIQLHILTQKTQKPTDTNQSENENPIRQYEFEIEKSNRKKLPSMVCEILVIPSLSLSLSHTSRSFVESVGSKSKTHLTKKLEAQD